MAQKAANEGVMCRRVCVCFGHVSQWPTGPPMQSAMLTLAHCMWNWCSPLVTTSVRSYHFSSSSKSLMWSHLEGDVTTVWVDRIGDRRCRLHNREVMNKNA